MICARFFAGCCYLALMSGAAAALKAPEVCVEFDGLNSGIELDVSDYLNTGDIAISAWVKLNSHNPPQIVVNQGSRGELVTFYLWRDGFRMLVQYDGEQYTSAVADPPPLGEWAHLLGAYNGEEIAIYVNGEEVDRTEAAGRLPQSEAPLYIGTQARARNSLDGALSDVRVYNRSLNARQAREVAAGNEPFETALVVSLDAEGLAEAQKQFMPRGGKIKGYRLIWYDLGQRSEYGSKYSGALGTYTAKHHPMAIYVEEVDKTFFVYGGTPAADQRYLLAMAGYYDHSTGRVPQPTVVMDKDGVDDPHDNPSMQIDDEGYIWVFVSGRGARRPGATFRSSDPYCIESFKLIRQAEYTYPQPWHVRGKGFVKMFTKYSDGRELYWSVSEAGEQWSEDRKLAGMGGHYQVSNEKDGRVITAFNMHPGGNVDRRTNLYFVKSSNMGETWQLADEEIIETPIKDEDSAALIHDYRAEERLVYVKDIGFDHEDRPVILYLTSANFRPGPPGEPRLWKIAHWRNDGWAIHEITNAWHNYDMGSLYIEESGVWKIIAPTEEGPQKWGTGGEVAIWVSNDEGRNWEKVRNVTVDSRYNHAYVRRPVNAHSDFYAMWADGSPDELTPSHLYISTRDGSAVWRLPYEMEVEFAKPELVD